MVFGWETAEMVKPTLAISSNMFLRMLLVPDPEGETAEH